MKFHEVEKLMRTNDISIVDAKSGEILLTLKRSMDKKAHDDFVGYYAQREVVYIQSVNFRTLEVGVKNG